MPISLVEEHTSLCVAAHASKYQCFLANARLSALNKELATSVLSVKWPIPREPIFVQVIFEALFVYMVIADKANEECLFSGLRGMKLCNGNVRAMIQEAITTAYQKLRTLTQIAQTTKEKTGSREIVIAVS